MDKVYVKVQVGFVALFFLLLNCGKKLPNRILYTRKIPIRTITVEQTDSSMTILCNVKDSVTGKIKSDLVWHLYKCNGLYYTNDYGLKNQLVMSNAVKKKISMECLRNSSSEIKSILIYMDNFEKKTFCSQILSYDHLSCPSMLIRYDKDYKIKNIYIFNDSLEFYPIK